MAETILTPGQNKDSQQELTQVVNPNYLTKDNLLSEFETESEKSVVRYNLGVPAAEDVYTKEEVEPIIIDRIKKKIAESLDSSDFITRVVVETLLEDFVRLDGTTPFTSPQAGVEPKSSHDLTTKRYVDSLIQTCLKQADKTKILEQVENLLKDYVKENNVYTKDDVYTKGEIDDKNSQFMKSDGTTPFTRPVSGRTPSISSHLTTKKYVDDLLETHKQDIDPHGFIEKLTNKLKKYALAEQVYDRSQTYSRGQIDSIIDKLVGTAVEEALEMHHITEDPHGIIDKVKELGYVLPNGTTPFREPQAGQDAVNPSDLVTLRQVNKKVSEVQEKIKDIPEPVWKTSGPVQSTVGHVEDDTEVPTIMTLQQVCDAIFYGNGIDLTVPEYVIITERCPITLCVHGSTANIDYAELLQNGVVIATLHGKDFEDGCITMDSEPLDTDAEFVFKVYYRNGAMHEETELVKCYMPVFVGLLPKWKFGNVVTMDYLIELCNEDENNRFLNQDKNLESYYNKELTTFTFEYDYTGAELKHPFVVLPETYPDLSKMITKSQSFGIEAFDVIDAIPMQIPGVEKDMIYKMYIYRQALSSINQEVTFNFKPKA